MGAETQGKIKGFVMLEEIFNFIREKWDKNVTCRVNRTVLYPHIRM